MARRDRWRKWPLGPSCTFQTKLNVQQVRVGVEKNNCGHGAIGIGQHGTIPIRKGNEMGAGFTQCGTLVNSRKRYLGLLRRGLQA
ncbi:hypothetical protein O9992_29960 [Vibrio lentus]|nr:hypothetical protein [Vibrio lentus]